MVQIRPSLSIIEPRKPPIIITDAPSSNLDRTARM